MDFQTTTLPVRVPTKSGRDWSSESRAAQNQAESAFLLENATLSSDRNRSGFQDRLLKTIGKYGFSVVKLGCSADVRESVSLIGQEFGGVVGHDRSEDDGLILISSIEKDSVYVGQLPKQHLPHTDGCFLEQPPDIMILGCESSAVHGGESILISGKAVFNSLMKEAPWALKLLGHRDCVSFVRGNRAAAHSIFSPIQGFDSRLKVVFRCDDVARASTKSVELAFEKMKQIVLSEAVQIRFKLEPGDILIVDNTSMLHGRTSFKDGLQRRRLWRGNYSCERIQSHILGFDVADERKRRVM